MSNETTSELPFGVTLPVVPALATQFGGLDGFTFTGPVQLHVDGTFRVQVLRDATLGSGSFGVTISGYLVDVP
jgi:hypothetical protein